MKTQEEEIMIRLEQLYNDLAMLDYDVVDPMIDKISDYESDPSQDTESDVIKLYNKMLDEIDYVIHQMSLIESLEDRKLYIEMDEFISWLGAYRPLVKFGSLSIENTPTYFERTYSWLNELKRDIEIKGNDIDDIVGIVENH